MAREIAKVVEVSTTPMAAFAGMVLAEAGAEVVRVSHLPNRAAGIGVPSPADTLFLSRGKDQRKLDLTSAPGKQAFRDLVSRADAVVEDLRPALRRRFGLGYSALRRLRSDVVLVTVTPFGLTGPWKDWQGPEITIQAAGGVLGGTGYAGCAPFKLPGDVAQHIAGLNAATAVLAGLYGVRSGHEPGVHFDISAQETFAAHWARHISQYAYSGARTRRSPRGMGLQGFPHTAQASDGLVYLLALRAEWESFAFFLGLEQFITPEWSDPRTRVARWEEIAPVFEASLASKGRYEWTAEAAEHGYTFAPVDDALSIAASPQLKARDFFSMLDVGDSQALVPGLPFKFDRSWREDAPGEAHRSQKGSS